MRRSRMWYACAGQLLAIAVLATMSAPVAAQSTPVRLLGEVRVRGEAERTALLDTIDAFTLLRTRFGVEAALSSRATVFVQVQDARTFGEEASTVNGVAPRLDLHQGWLQYRQDMGALDVSLRAGRQEILFGNERLVGAAGWTNTGRAFDALRLTLGARNASWRLHTFAATVSERGRRLNGVSAEMDDHLLAGAYLEAGKLEAFALHDREAAYRTATGVDRTTVGGRLQSPELNGFTAAVEGAYQFGNQLWSVPLLPVAQDIEAYFVGARLAYATPLPVLARIGAGVDLLSGDDDANDDSYSAFNTLYATNHRYYGYLDLFLDPAARTREHGLLDAMASARVSLAQSLALDIDVHAFQLQRELAAADERLLGWELDFTLPLQLGTGQSLQLGYSLFRNGAAAPLIGLGPEKDTWHWAYIQAAFAFGGSIVPIM